MESIRLKEHGDLLWQYDPVAVTETRTFRDILDRTYLVYRYPRSDGKYGYHVFMEVDTQASSRAYRRAGGEGDNEGNEWWNIWQEHTKPKDYTKDE
jgi:hypothetical protein